ncbi:hypothetical protein P279_29335, partial [Rhodobacteraceae bacterium PD-2]
GDGGVVDAVLGDDGLLDGVAGDDGLVDTALDTVTGDGGVVDAVLGEGGLLDGVAGDDGLVDSALDTVTGGGGLFGSLLGALAPEDTVAGGAALLAAEPEMPVDAAGDAEAEVDAASGTALDDALTEGLLSASGDDTLAGDDSSSDRGLDADGPLEAVTGTDGLVGAAPDSLTTLDDPADTGPGDDLGDDLGEDDFVDTLLASGGDEDLLSGLVGDDDVFGIDVPPDLVEDVDDLTAGLGGLADMGGSLIEQGLLADEAGPDDEIDSLLTQILGSSVDGDVTNSGPGIFDLLIGGEADPEETAAETETGDAGLLGQAEIDGVLSSLFDTGGGLLGGLGGAEDEAG